MEDEGPHLLVALEAGEGLAHGSSRRPADKIKSDAFPKSCCLHGEGGGAEDLLVVHLVLGDEQANCRLRQFLEGHPQGSLGLPFALEAGHQGVQGGAVGLGPGLDALRGGGGILQDVSLLLGEALPGHKVLWQGNFLR